MLAHLRISSSDFARTLPELCPNIARTLPEHFPNFARTLPELCPNIARTLPEHCPNFARTLPELCPNIARTLPELCPNIARTLPKHCPNFSRTLPEPWMENSITKSDWLFPHHPTPNAKFQPITLLLNRPTYHKSAKVSPQPFPQIFWAPQFNE